MKDGFIELKSTEGHQVISVRKAAIDAFEVVPASARVEGHIKIYVGGHKFLVRIEEEELIKQLKD